ncbi:Pre-mRNA cleavage complex II protein Clp1-domain-containing protein [Dendryphion nanum]|uniref:Polynucleotide 5'-hydroxyl-kinase GRC3 n=1 Tax=Dendryphion nanum TaxID=256645 RepID=A0A9P9DB03_9PLEO|nr:Pre-mRNA cleavage complex II protein Clp1-domain-containing protein [Dendryphion nanum]
MMSLPGLAGLPGLNSATLTELTAAATAISRTKDLSANTELRFEVSFSQTLTVKLVTGTAELFGTELGPSSTYTFRGTKAAIYTWHGCKIELTGEVDSEYVAEESQMMSYANAHFALEELRDRAAATKSADGGPRVLVVGPENSGKTSLVRVLTSYAVKMGRRPLVVNLDPRQGMLGVPGSFTAAAFSSILDIEEGWGSSPISGPSPTPVKNPLVYHYGLENPEEGKVFRPLVTRMALAVTSRLEEDADSKTTGFVVDAPGAISNGKGGVYENIEHIVSEFSINILFTLGSERLYSDLLRKYSSRDPSDPVHIIRLDKSGGAVTRDESYMKALRQSQIKAYFFGLPGDTALNPHSHMADFDDLNIFRVVDVTSTTPSTFHSGDEHDTFFNPSNPTSTNASNASSIYEKVTPSSLMQNSLLAISTAGPNERHEVIRDASIRGYIYVADVDEGRKKVRLLSPQAGQTPGTALLLGRFPEDVAGLVS